MAREIEFHNANMVSIIQFHNAKMVGRFWFHNASISSDNFNYFYKTIEKTMILTIPLTSFITTTTRKGDSHITHSINVSFTLQFEIFIRVISYFRIWNGNTNKNKQDKLRLLRAQ